MAPTHGVKNRVNSTNPVVALIFTGDHMERIE
jgi:hypothetical protein